MFLHFHHETMGNDSQFEEHIFQMGGSNHQLGTKIEQSEGDFLFMGI